MRYGSSYVFSAPAQNTTPGIVFMDFAPNWQPGDPLTGLAYCMYHFTVTGYDQSACIRLEFGTTPAAANIWVALADWNKNCWHWFGGSQVVLNGNIARVNAGSFTPYFDFGGDLLLAVVLTGNTGAELQSVRLGGVPPLPGLTASPQVGSVPLEVVLDASGTTNSDGTITKYEWDLDGDGVFETDTGHTPSTTATYTANAEEHPAVRVTNSFGAKATSSVPVQAVGGWKHTWGRSGSDSIEQVVADASGNIYAVGTAVKPEGAYNCDLLLMKWSPTGGLLWAKTLDSGSQEYGLDVKLDSAGHPITCGFTEVSGSRDVLVARWDASGGLVWARRAGGSASDSAPRLVVRDGGIYVGVNTASLTSHYDIGLARFLDDGELDWQTAVSVNNPMEIYDLVGRTGLLATNQGFVAVAEVNVSGQRQIIKAEWNMSGSLDSLQQLGDLSVGQCEPHLLRTYNNLTFEATYYIAGKVDQAGMKPFLLITDGDGACQYCNFLNTSNEAYIQDISFAPNGHLFVSGYGMTAGSSVDALLFEFNPADAEYIGEHVWGLQAGQNRGYGIYGFYGGLLMCGIAPDAASSLITPLIAAYSYSMDFTPIIGLSPSMAWTSCSFPATVEDHSSEGVLDLGAGSDDTLLMHWTEY